MHERDVEANDERRPLTVLFSDLVRSTGLSASIDDEEFVAVIDAYYGIVEEVCARHGGYIAQHLGDGVFVWFGYPITREDDADRAVTAGFELIELLREPSDALERKLGVRFDARVGIHSGSAVVRPVPEGGFTSLGFTVNFAAKVQAAAPIGGVLISEATLELLRWLPEVHPAGDISVSGAEGTIHVFHVTGPAPAYGVPPLTVLAPLVGRDEACAHLVASWEEAATAPGSTVVVAGTAGIGKTRIARELARVAERTGRVLWLRCDRYREAVSFWPVRSAVLALAGFVGPNRATSANRVQHLLEQHGLAPAAAAAVIRALALEAGDVQTVTEVDPLRAHSDALDGIVTLLGSLACDEPVLLVVEDLQFADASTIELVERLAASNRPGLLVLATMRHEGQVETVSRASTCIELEPLDDAESTRLLELLDPSGAIDAEQRTRLVGQSGGIPLFIEALVFEEARTDVSGIRRALLPHSAVPVALQRPILARIEAAHVDSSVTKAAAVIGNRFALDVLAAVTRRSLDELREAMGELQRLELITPLGDDVYEFRHSMIRDLAYDMLVAESRARLHSSTADALLALRKPDASLLAFHYEHGGRFAEAIDAGLRAGIESRDSGAYREAETVLTRTIELLNAGHGGADSDDKLLLAHQLRGFFRVATAPDVYRSGDEDYHAGLEVLRRHDPGPEVLWTLAGQWADAMFRGLLDDAVEILDLFRSVAIARAPEALPANTAGYGIVASLRADYAEARRLLEDALGQIDRDGWPESLVRNWTTPDYPPITIRAHLSPVLTMLGDTTAARQRAAEAEEIANELPWPIGPFGTAYAKAYQAAALGTVGDGAAVLALGGAIQQIGSERGLEFWEKLGLLYLAVGSAQMFPSAMTISGLELTLDALKTAGSEALLLPYVSNAAAAAMLKTDENERALQVLDEAIRSGQAHGIRCYESEALRLRAEALDRLGKDGRSDLQAAIRLAHDQHAVLYELRARLAHEASDASADERRSCRAGITELLAGIPEDSDLAEVAQARQLTAV